MNLAVIVASLAATALDPAPVELSQAHVPAPSGVFLNVCQLTVTRRNMKTLFLGRPVFDSSAFLYRDRYLVTAAHNVHSDFFSRLLAADVFCGAADVRTTRANGSFRRPDVHVLDGYTFRRPYPARYERDVAVVRLQQPICLTRPARLGEADPAGDDPIHLAGYPSRRGDRDGMNGKRLYYREGRLSRAAEPYLVRHDVAAIGGNSGSPIWIQRGNEQIVVGIHVGSGGSARRFNAAMLGEIDALIDTLEAARPTPRGERCPQR
jgi:V8-like Glu-specific endopeptidase